jgi:hypothetical protein
MGDNLKFLQLHGMKIKHRDNFTFPDSPARPQENLHEIIDF